MADDEHGGEAADEETAPAADSGGEQAVDQGDGAETAITEGEPVGEAELEREGLRRRLDRNRATWGRLILHYPARDVAVPLDGSTAMRVLQMFAERRSDWTGDRFDWTSSAMNGWFVYDSTEPIAMSWEPHLPGMEGRRTVIDPPAAA